MTDAVLQAAKLHWGLEDAPFDLVAARENKVYRVETGAGPAALRLHRPHYRDAAELQSELAWMKMLGQGGLLVPEPIAATDGSTELVVDGVIVDLLTWLTGQPLSAIEARADTYRDLGRLMATMHDLADAWPLPNGFKRPTWDLTGETPTWGRFWENPYLTAQQADQFIKFRDVAREALMGFDSDVGLIHADLVPDNVLLHDGVLRPIDFDDGGIGERLFDIATVTFRTRRSDPTGALAAAVIAGYTRRSVDPDALLWFEALRACSYVGWNIPRMQEPGGKERNARFVHAAEISIARIFNA